MINLKEYYLSLHAFSSTRPIKKSLARTTWLFFALDPLLVLGFLPYFSLISLFAPLTPCLCFIFLGCEKTTSKAQGGFGDH